MTEETAAAFQREGIIPVATEGNAEETAPDSQSEEENQEGATQSAEGENIQTEEDKLPFHEHPRWKQREDEWLQRFNSQEVRHQTELKEALSSIREEFGTARKDNAEQTKIPAWFGGDQSQWDAYRADRETELKAAEDRAYERVKSETTSQDKAVEEATTFLRSEVSAIESDRALNPSGAKVDAEKLFKVVFDNQLIDAQGRWNYRAGYKLMTAGAPAPAPKPNTQRKEVAAAVTGDAKPETKPTPYKTSEDFKKNRPW